LITNVNKIRTLLQITVVNLYKTYSFKQSFTSDKQIQSTELVFISPLKCLFRKAKQTKLQK